MPFETKLLENRGKNDHSTLHLTYQKMEISKYERIY
jgi:hypothetical protein